MYDLAFLIATPIFLIAALVFYSGVKKTGRNARGGVSVMAWGYYIGLVGVLAAALIFLFV
ncbi:MAG: hypothetical protein PHE15_07235 [Dehalococcoidales bacterium]|nr:hypothetical protein [Dehalococcoidales bacterium]